MMLRALVIAVALSNASAVVAQRVEDGWEGLRPFKSTRADVEKIFGVGKLQERFPLLEYHTADAVIIVRYAGKPCDESSDSFYRKDIPADTVFDYEVRLKGSIPLSDFTFDTRRFAREDLGSAFYYYYQARRSPYTATPNQWGVNYGIGFETQMHTGREHVTAFHYGVPWEEAEKRHCNNPPSLPPL